MTITSQNAVAKYDGDGATTSFATPAFTANSQIKAFLRNSDGTRTAWTEGTQYTLAGAGVAAGGTLSVNTSPTNYTPAVGTKLIIKVDPPRTQDTALSGIDPTLATPLVAQIDKLTLMVQALAEEVNRCVKVPLHDLQAISPNSTELAVDTGRKNKVFAFNASTGLMELVAKDTLGGGVGSSLPVPETTAIAHKSGNTGITARVSLANLTASRVITLPDSDINLGPLALFQALTGVSSADAREIIQINAAGTAFVLARQTGHDNPGVQSPGDAAYTVAPGTTKRLIRFTTPLTAARTLTLGTTGIWNGYSVIVETAGIGDTYDLTISGASGGNVAMGDNEVAFCTYEDGAWYVLCVLPRRRAFNFRNSAAKNIQLAQFFEGATSISSSAGLITMDADTSPVYGLTMTENVTGGTLDFKDDGFSSIMLMVKQDSSVQYTFALSGVTWLNGTAPDFSSLSLDKHCLILLFQLPDIFAGMTFGYFIMPF